MPWLPSPSYAASSRPADALLVALAAAWFSRYGQLHSAATPLPAQVNEALIEAAGLNRERNRLVGHQGRE
jgi:hypothetical protein